MDKQPLLDFIRNHSPANPDVIAYIAGHFEEVNLAKNDFFLKEQTVSDHYLFLSEGIMRAFAFDTDGHEVTTYFYTKNRIVFEAASFFMRSKSAENIQALTDCEGFFITFEKLNMLFHSVPEFREFGRAMLVKEFVAFKQRTLSMINTTAEARYADLMASNPEILQFVQLKYIASYLGITDTSLSRIRKDFSKKR